MGKHIFVKFRNAEEIKEINDCSPQGAGFIQTKFMVNYKQQSRKLTSDSNTMQRMEGLEIELIRKTRLAVYTDKPFKQKTNLLGEKQWSLMGWILAWQLQSEIWFSWFRFDFTWTSDSGLSNSKKNCVRKLYKEESYWKFNRQPLD